MTDVLLAHGFFLSNDEKQRLKMRPYPPLGTLYAASHLRQRGRSVALFDAMLAGGIDDFRVILDRARPRVLALFEDQFNFLNKMCLTHVREALFEMTAMARSRGIVVLAAGSDPSDHPEVYLEGGVDYVLVREADHTLVEVVDALLDDRRGEVPEIPGVVLEHEGELRAAARRVPERQPDVFPFPAWDLVDFDAYRAAWTDAHGYFSVNMVSTRGCPFHCNWCAKPIWGQRYAMRTPANVAEELGLLKRIAAPDHVWFADDIFGLRKDWVADFAREVAERDAAIPFTIQTRADLMTPGAVEGLARAGCREVWLGAESGSQKILDRMDKGTRVEQIVEARRLLGEHGIRACYFIQFGYPGEEWDDIMATVRLVRETLPNDIGVSVSYPLPGTTFHQLVQVQIGSKDRWRESNDLTMMFRGTYGTEFYRHLHRLLHRDLDHRRRVQGHAGAGAELLRELDELNAAWCELGRLERQHKNVAPTELVHDAKRPEPPDLSHTWN